MQIINGPSILVLIGAILAAIGVFWQANNQMKSEQELRNKADRIAELTTKNAELTTENKNILIGGESFCYMLISFPMGIPNSIERDIVVEGEYPLYDIQMTITDLDKFSTLRLSKIPIEKRMSAVETCKITKNLGNIRNNAALTMGRLHIPPEKTSVRFNIDFSARNGSWRQRVLVKRKNEGGWLLANRVYRGDEILIDYVSKDFPRNEKGEIDW